VYRLGLVVPVWYVFVVVVALVLPRLELPALALVSALT
jgi:hypothetical protein